jgi:hypothetical protein
MSNAGSNTSMDPACDNKFHIPEPPSFLKLRRYNGNTKKVVPKEYIWVLGAGMRS